MGESLSDQMFIRYFLGELAELLRNDVDVCSGEFLEPQGHIRGHRGKSRSVTLLNDRVCC